MLAGTATGADGVATRNINSLAMRPSDVQPTSQASSYVPGPVLQVALYFGMAKKEKSARVGSICPVCPYCPSGSNGSGTRLFRSSSTAV
jgi:hypothetical protein